MTKDEELSQEGLYDWCAELTQREIDSNFKTLSRVKSSLATRYVEFMGTSSDKTGKKASALALVKRFHLPALRLKGEAFTDTDQQLVDEFLDFARRKRFSAKAAVPGVRTRAQRRGESCAGVRASTHQMKTPLNWKRLLDPVRSGGWKRSSYCDWPSISKPKLLRNLDRPNNWFQLSIFTGAAAGIGPIVNCINQQSLDQLNTDIKVADVEADLAA